MIENLVPQLAEISLVDTLNSKTLMNNVLSAFDPICAAEESIIQVVYGSLFEIDNQYGNLNYFVIILFFIISWLF